MLNKAKKNSISTRFRGLLPVVVDVETSGLNPATDGLLEIAAVTLTMNEQGTLLPQHTYDYRVEPFVGANIDPESLAITRIDPECALRSAITEQHALHLLFSKVSEAVKLANCQRAVLVGHNAWFDLAFVLSAAKRCDLLSANPFHSFTSFDTATLAGAALGETVLARALKAAHISFDINCAHSAVYDTQKTAELFCWIINKL